MDPIFSLPYFSNLLDRLSLSFLDHALKKAYFKHDLLCLLRNTDARKKRDINGKKGALCKFLVNRRMLQK
jgi:hypothetical protein